MSAPPAKSHARPENRPPLTSTNKSQHLGSPLARYFEGDAAHNRLVSLAKNLRWLRQKDYAFQPLFSELRFKKPRSAALDAHSATLSVPLERLYLIPGGQVSGNSGSTPSLSVLLSRGFLSSTVFAGTNDASKDSFAHKQKLCELRLV
jgi:hypothetical protein